MRNIASAVGVSVQTVSRVVNNHPDVAVETREKVQKVIDRVGYRPNALARSLSSQRSYTIGLVIAGLNLIGPSTLLNGITHASEEGGYSLILKELPSFDTEDITAIFNTLISRQVDGIIWAVPEVTGNRNWLNELPYDYQVPLVYLTMEPQEDITTGSVDNFLGGQLATSHLLEQGCRNIGHIAGPLDWWESRQRMKGWKDTLINSGHGVEERFITMGDWSSDSGAKALMKLLDQYPEMDGLFVANDQMALGAYYVLNERELRVPQDIALVGFDNIQESAYFLPPLTTVQQKQSRVGESAVRELINLIELGWNGTDVIEPKTILIEPTLIIRQSSIRL
jgi:DNA-binding LacI/PurR family transcriptional regulator